MQQWQNLTCLLVVREHRLGFPVAGSTADAQNGLHLGLRRLWLTVGRMSDKKSACRHPRDTVPMMPADNAEYEQSRCKVNQDVATCVQAVAATSQAAVQVPTFASLMPSGTLRALISASGTLAYSACKGQPHQCVQHLMHAQHFMLDCSPEVSTNLTALIAPCHCRVSAAAEQHKSDKTHAALLHLS